MNAWGRSGHGVAAKPAVEAIVRINAELEKLASSRLTTEDTLLQCWSQVRQLKSDGPGSWLLLVRLAEAALVCAGNYADNGEFEAAGDLLVNPRQILVHEPAKGRSTTKKRHGRLSAQFGLNSADDPRAMKRFSAGMCLEITKPALLPHMTQVLKGSHGIAAAYVQRLEDGQRRIAETLGFLAAWGVFDSAQLWQRLQACSRQEKNFAESHLCRFDGQVFGQIGKDLQRSLAKRDYRSRFLSSPPVAGSDRTQTSPAAALAFAGAPS